jgi:hypothetical protein
VRIETGIDRPQCREAAHRQSGTGEQHQRERDLRCDEYRTNPAAPRTFSRPSSTIAERFRHLASRDAHGRQQSKGEACHQRDDRRERQHGRVEPDRFGARETAPGKRNERAQPGLRQQDA